MDVRTELQSYVWVGHKWTISSKDTSECFASTPNWAHNRNEIRQLVACPSYSGDAFTVWWQSIFSLLVLAPGDRRLHTRTHTRIHMRIRRCPSYLRRHETKYAERKQTENYNIYWSITVYDIGIEGFYFHSHCAYSWTERLRHVQAHVEQLRLHRHLMLRNRTLQIQMCFHFCWPLSHLLWFQKIKRIRTPFGRSIVEWMPSQYCGTYVTWGLLCVTSCVFTIMHSLKL